MTHIEKMLEELERRNYSQTTVRIYRRTICDLERYFRRSADELKSEPRQRQIRFMQHHSGRVSPRQNKLFAQTLQLTACRCTQPQPSSPTSN